MVNSNCSESPVLQNIVYTYIAPILCSMAAISMLPMIHVYISGYQKRTKRPTFLIASVFFFILLVDFIVLILNNALYCHHKLAASIAGITAYYLYMIQAWLLVSVFSIRLVFIFDSSAYEVSKAVYVVIAIGIVFTTISISLLLFAKPALIGVILVALIWLAWLCYMIWLNYKLIWGLRAISKSANANQSHHSMTTVIIKTTILCLISSCISLITLIFVAGRDMLDNMYFGFMSELFILLDLYTNAMSVFLSFSRFGKWYFKLCGCCHRRFSSCFGMDTEIDTVRMRSHTVEPHERPRSLKHPASSNSET